MIPLFVTLLPYNTNTAGGRIRSRNIIEKNCILYKYSLQRFQLYLITMINAIIFYINYSQYQLRIYFFYH